MNRLAISFIVAVAATVMPIAAEAQMPKVHLVIVADTDDALIGKDVKKDWKNVLARFTENVPDKQLVVRELTGKKVTRDRILNTIKRLSVGSKDTVVFVYAGHGLFDLTNSNGKQKGHAFKLNHGPPGSPLNVTVPGTAIQIPTSTSKVVYRTEVVEALQKQKPRLTVLWTDCCNMLANINATSSGRARSVVRSPKDISPLFKSLFFEPKGLVDLATSKPGELAWGIPKGGVATVVWCRLLTANRANQMSWDTLFGLLQKEVAGQFVKSFPSGARASAAFPLQTTQTMYRFGWSLESGASQATPATKGSFGVTVADDPSGRGVQLTVVRPGSAAATRVVAVISGQTVTGKMSVGDIITHINDAPIKTQAQFGTEFDKSPITMRIRFLNSNNNFAPVNAMVDLSER
ncbi:MAG: hypothetical protein AB8G99_14610 [Planctomycetaceae bacterium]